MRAAGAGWAVEDGWMARIATPPLARVVRTSGRAGGIVADAGCGQMTAPLRVRDGDHAEERRALLVQPAPEEAEQALGHEDDHGGEDDAHRDQIELGEEPREAFAEAQEEGGPHDRAHHGADPAQPVADHAPT